MQTIPGNRQRHPGVAAAAENGMSRWDRIVYVLTFAPVIGLIAGVWSQPFVPIAELLRDPLAVAELSEDCCHVHYGFVSNIGVLVWTAGAAILLFAGLLVFRRGGPRDATVFLVSAGLFTGWLMLDDFFLVHEDVLPKLGVPQLVTYAVYMALGLVYVALSWRRILDARAAMLIVAVCLLAYSVGTDVFIHSDSDIRILIEDGAKLAGIAAWVSFHIEAAFGLISVPEALRAPSRTASETAFAEVR